MPQTSQKLVPVIGPATELDRLSAKRRDKEWLAAEKTSSNAAFLVLVDLKPVVANGHDDGLKHIKWFGAQDLAGLGVATDQAFFLGRDDEGRSCFALEVPLDRLSGLNDPSGLLDATETLRALGFQEGMDNTDLARIGEAYAMAAWHKMHLCCGRCGAHTIMRDGGWRRKCRSCYQEYYPRTDPVVIMAIRYKDKLLLGREPRFPDGFYSVLAGFVEPGESIEEAVRRETLEEAGIETREVGYVASQPWPFPHALMIGCDVEAVTTEIVLDKTELEDAQWFSRDDIAKMLAGAHDKVTLPPPLTIAHTLIKRFANL